MTFEIRKSKNKRYYSVLIADNGQVLMTSEMYTTKGACRDTVFSIANTLVKNIPEINDVTKN
jgi:uncharacterized protein YegP (UPF0339 family)